MECFYFKKYTELNVKLPDFDVWYNMRVHVS